MTLYLGCPLWAYQGWVGNSFPGGARSVDFLRAFARRPSTVQGKSTFLRYVGHP